MIRFELVVGGLLMSSDDAVLHLISMGLVKYIPMRSSRNRHSSDNVLNSEGRNIQFNRATNFSGVDQFQSTAQLHAGLRVGMFASTDKLRLDDSRTKETPPTSNTHIHSSSFFVGSARVLCYANWAEHHGQSPAKTIQPDDCSEHSRRKAVDASRR